MYKLWFRIKWYEFFFFKFVCIVYIYVFIRFERWFVLCLFSCYSVCIVYIVVGFVEGLEIVVLVGV